MPPPPPPPHTHRDREQSYSELENDTQICLNYYPEKKLEDANVVHPVQESASCPETQGGGNGTGEQYSSFIIVSNLVKYTSS